MGGGRVRLGKTPDGLRLEVSRVVDAPVETVWRLFTDTRYWSAWGPSVSAVESRDAVIRPGTTGRVRVAGVWVPFRIERCGDGRWTWRVAGVPATGHRVEPHPDGCRAVFEVPLPAAPYAVVCERALRNLAGLARGDDPPSSLD